MIRFRFEYKDSAWKLQLLLCKRGIKQHKKYSNLILSCQPRDQKFVNTVKTLTKVLEISLDFSTHEIGARSLLNENLMIITLVQVFLTDNVNALSYNPSLTTNSNIYILPKNPSNLTYNHKI